MKIPRIVKAMGHIDEDLISNAASVTKKKSGSVWIKWGVMAACLCLVLVGIAIPIPDNEKHGLGQEEATSQQEELLPVSTDEGPANEEPQDYIEILEFNGVEYAVYGEGETDILKECGISSELTQDLAGEHVCYLGYERGTISCRYFPVEEAGPEEENDIELFEYAPEPNEDVYILCKAGEYYAAIRKDILLGN